MTLYLHITRRSGRLEFATSDVGTSKYHSITLATYECDPILLSEEEENYGLKLLAQAYEFGMLGNGRN